MEYFQSYKENALIAIGCGLNPRYVVEYFQSSVSGRDILPCEES